MNVELNPRDCGRLKWFLWQSGLATLLLSCEANNCYPSELSLELKFANES